MGCAMEWLHCADCPCILRCGAHLGHATHEGGGESKDLDESYLFAKF